MPIFFVKIFGQGLAVNESVELKKEYDFHPPFNIPLFLSGNFGEPRSTHFHTGIDIRSNARVGLDVFAIEDGYVSRIGISSKGYGKVLYITHPKHQLTSVYAHLINLSPELNDYIKHIQYAQRRFEIDTILPNNLLRVTKGQVIAYSGNTGGSGGPHLHFEMRDSKTAETINPLLFGFKVQDDYAPSLMNIKLYDLGEKKNNAINKILPLQKINGIYTIAGGEVTVNTPYLGISVNAFDKSLNSIGRNGLFNIQLISNGVVLFESKMDRIHFDDWRFSYSYADYDERTSRDAIFHKCFIDPCNEARMYPQYENNGIIKLDRNGPNEIKILLSDFSNNISEIKFTVYYDPQAPLFAHKLADEQSIFYCSIENSFENDFIQVAVPQGSLADDIPFKYKMIPSTKYYSNIFQVHANTDPLLDSIYISIKPQNLPAHLQSKAMIAYQEGEAIKSAGGYYNKGQVETWFNKFGKFFVTTDIIPPRILQCNIVKNKRFAGKVFSFRASDNLSGIKEYNAYIDDQWILFEHDLKALHFFHIIEGNIEPGNHTLRIELEDYKGNKGIYSYPFIK
ncbi:MAG: M23 family metallopeptidase [Chitinophagales bacterium]|nr:M23 family metallopeptidase [Chitinophagales bacterium]